MLSPSGIDIREFTFEDSTTPYSMQDYMDVRDAFVERVSASQDVKAVYQMGSIAAPGISDLDVIVVLADQLQSSKPMDYSIERMGSKEQYLFMHNPFVVNQHVFENLDILFYAANLKKLVGDDIQQIQLPQASVDYVKMAILIDYGVELLHRLTKPQLTKFVFVRTMLPILNSIRYSIGLASDVGIVTEPSWVKFSDEINKLRQSWLSAKDHEMLVQLIIDGLAVLCEIFTHVDELLQTKIMALPDISSDGLKYAHHSVDGATIFTKGSRGLYERWPIDYWGTKYLDIQLGAKRKVMASTLAAAPLSFYYHFASYSHGRGRYSSYIEKMLGCRKDNEVKIDRVYQDVMTQRIETYDAYKRFIRQNRLFGCDLGFFGAHKFDLVKNMGLKEAVQRAELYPINWLNHFTSARKAKTLRGLISRDEPGY